MSATQKGRHKRRMTYLEQYINQMILPRYLRDWLMESLKKLKEPKNERQIKKIHKFIDYVEENKGKKLPLYQKAFLELMVTDDKYNRSKRKYEA